MRSLFGVQRDPLREYTATKQNQVDDIVDVLRTRLGTNPRVFFAADSWPNKEKQSVWKWTTALDSR